MSKLPVHWYEGMFLGPEHCQVTDRYWDARLRAVGQWDHPHHYGLYYLRLDESALLRSEVIVNSCAARLKEGTVVQVDEPLKGCLKKLEAELTRGNRVQVLLAVPRVQEGQAIALDRPPR